MAIEFPQLNVPVLDRRWSVWLPPGYLPSTGNRDLSGPARLAHWVETETVRAVGGVGGRAIVRRFFSRRLVENLGVLEATVGSLRAHAEEFFRLLGESLLSADSDGAAPC